MSNDLTVLFRARAKVIQARFSAKKGAKSEDEGYFGDENAEEKSTSSANFSLFINKAIQIRRDISRLRDVLISKRKDYITAIGHHPEFALSGMSEEDRDRLDNEASQGLQHCSKVIRLLNEQIHSVSYIGTFDELNHLQEVLKGLECYLKAVAKIVTDLRAVRIKKTNDRQRITKLQSLVQIRNKFNESQGAENWNTSLVEKNANHVVHQNQIRKRQLYHSIDEDDQPSFENDRGDSVRKVCDSSSSQDKSKSLVTKVFSFDDAKENSVAVEEIFTKEEELQLTVENEELFSRLSEVDKDVHRLTKQMTEIRQLQETFAEKIVSQEKDINTINEAAVFTVENICEGNKQVREAIQNIASRRVILLFCIIVLTFTLLFLDWYNP